MKFLPFVVILALLLVFYLATQRNRQRADAAQQARRESIVAGTEVMTTSGLYGTVVAVDPDSDAATLRIAPGVEVRWTMAALREPRELPDRYRPGVSLEKPDASGRGIDD